ncbi:MAG: hypothetical protein U9Q03_01550 [Patescibacteria group bacterium]|nr:hypothetical protein [Patescibacteria group bacterium]
MQHLTEALTERLTGRYPPPDVVLDTARRLHGDKKIELRFISNEPNPYDEDGKRAMDIYRDANGFEYWFDGASGALLQAGLSEDNDPPTHEAGQESRLPVSALRERAILITGRMIPGFEQMLSTLHPLEANDRRSVYFFRWEDLSEPLSESELPPFVQVGLYPNGEIAGFTDTLSMMLPVVPVGEAERCAYPLPSWTKAEQPLAEA